MGTKLPVSFGAIANLCGDVSGKHDFRNVFLLWLDGTLDIAAAGPRGGIRVSMPCDQADWGECAVTGREWKRAFADAKRMELSEVIPVRGPSLLRLGGRSKKGEFAVDLVPRDGKFMSLAEFFMKPRVTSPKISVSAEMLALAAKVLNEVAPGVTQLETIVSGDMILTASRPELKAQVILMGCV
jgi:hypothetical protein